MAGLPEIVEALKAKFADAKSSEFRGETRVVVTKQDSYKALQWLKEVHNFDLLVDVTCVDYLNYRNATDRFGLAYLLANTITSTRITIRVMLNEPDLVVSSAVPLWEGANWMEREVWDMFGIRFDGHPDHRRILLPEEFSAHPLRKDYPLQGRGERHNFPVITRGEA